MGMAQLAEWSLSTPEDKVSNTAICNFNNCMENKE